MELSCSYNELLYWVIRETTYLKKKFELEVGNTYGDR